MKLRPLGDSSLMVTPIGMGMAALGRPGYITLGHEQDLQGDYSLEKMETRAHQVLNLAYERGIRYMDAARSYGKGEQFLATWIDKNGFSPQAIGVGSKWGYTYTADWQVQAEQHEVKDHSLPVLTRQWQESQALLGAHLGLYQVHSATLSSGILTNKDVLRELARLKSDYGILIGLSLSGPRQRETLEAAMSVQIDGIRLFDTVQATWNILEPSVGPALAEARKYGIGIIVKEALANGRLTSRNTDPSFHPQMTALTDLASQTHVSIDALAIAAVLAQPWADVVLSGAAQPDHLISNLQALEVRWDPAFETVLSSLVESPSTYWQTRSQLAWK